MIKDLEKHKNSIVESYELAEIKDSSKRFEKEIKINQNLTVLIEKPIDCKIPEIWLIFSNSEFNFSRYQTDFENKRPEIYEFFKGLFGNMFFYCEPYDKEDKYIWIGH